MISEQAQFLLAHFDRIASKLRDQDLVAHSHARCDSLSIAVEGAGTHGNDFGFVELFDCGFGEEDAGCGFGFGLDALDEDAVEEGSNGADGSDGRHCEGQGFEGRRLGT